MAHADYDCCAVCDRKLSYAGMNATTKEMICSTCAVNLAERGVFVHNVHELIAWIKTSDTEHVRKVLSEVGFSFCYYQNDVDDAVMEKGIFEVTDKNSPDYGMIAAG